MFSHICWIPSSFSDSILEVIVIHVQMKKTVKVQITQELNFIENKELLLMQKHYRLNLKCTDKRLLSSPLLLNSLFSSVRINDFKEMSRWLTQKGIYSFMRSSVFAFAFILHGYSFSFLRCLLCISPFRHTLNHWHFRPSFSLSLPPSTFTQPLSAPSHSDAWLYIWPL